MKKLLTLAASAAILATAGLTLLSTPEEAAADGCDGYVFCTNDGYTCKPGGTQCRVTPCISPM